MRTLHRIATIVLATVAFAFATNAKADTTLYSDGPTSGTIGALEISTPTPVEDSFTLAAASTLNSVRFGNWVLDGQTALTVQWAIVDSEGSLVPFCSSCSGTASLTAVTAPVANGNYYVLDQTFALPSINLSAGTYWLELENETTNGVDEIAFWDESAGPSMVWYSLYGDLSGQNCFVTFHQLPNTCSNAFTIYGTTTTSATPEPGSLALLGSALTLLAARIRRRTAGTS